MHAVLVALLCSIGWWLPPSREREVLRITNERQCTRESERRPGARRVWKEACNPPFCATEFALCLGALATAACSERLEGQGELPQCCEWMRFDAQRIWLDEKQIFPCVGHQIAAYMRLTTAGGESLASGL